jgi:NAD(P)-dependent dehydrogenase (short-subunit alcohol dehydrogenase family)
MNRWTSDDIPPLTGRRVIVTGATSGLGYETALELGRHGAHVVLAVRDRTRGEASRAALEVELAGVPGRGSFEVGDLDLASLESIHAFADGVVATGQELHLLVNNAGVMAIPRRETEDGFEMQLGTNHLGHMALTLRLLALLAATGAAGTASRVVTVSSNVHKSGRIDLDDLMGARSYKPWTAYSQSKLANLLFTYELQRRIDTAGLAVGAYAAHPGYSATNLSSVGPAMTGSTVQQWTMRLSDKLLAQSAAMGALPTLYAATLPGLAPASYVGPSGFNEWRGHPTLVAPRDTALDESVAAALWARSEELIGLRFADVVAS